MAATDVWASFDCSPVGVVRDLFLAGTSRIPAKKKMVYPIRGNACGACYIVRGEGEVVDDDTGKCYPFYPGCFVQWPPNHPHSRIIFPGIYVDKYFVFPPEYYLILLKMGLASPEHPVINLGLRLDIASRYDEVIRELQDQGELKLPLTVNKAFSLVLDLLLPHPAADQKYHREMERAARILEQDFQERCSIPELARSLKMSYTNFRRNFVRFYKISPIEYRIRRKIEKIQLLLSSQNILLKEVADRFGYADVYTFSHQFKKITGESPADFRNRKGALLPDLT